MAENSGLTSAHFGAHYRSEGGLSTDKASTALKHSLGGIIETFHDTIQRPSEPGKL